MHAWHECMHSVRKGLGKAPSGNKLVMLKISRGYLKQFLWIVGMAFILQNF